MRKSAMKRPILYFPNKKHTRYLTNVCWFCVFPNHNQTFGKINKECFNKDIDGDNECKFHAICITSVEIGHFNTDHSIILTFHDDVMKWKNFPRYWPFVRGIHRLPVNSPHKGQWRRALMFSLICALNKRLSKQSWGWWFDTPSRSSWLIVMFTRPTLERRATLGHLRSIKPNMTNHFANLSQTCQLLKNIFFNIEKNNPQKWCKLRLNW